MEEKEPEGSIFSILHIKFSSVFHTRNMLIRNMKLKTRMLETPKKRRQVHKF